ncbi:unnamed protein product [Thlaspi arvense]|uniref:Disease resistance R13L4/SHOC-2-like LRR domain-containing protein n=1 Tax=Thlaspi arvense TaxID=13288 RepID=A0AAU9S700_THLAR|nr:unnamed protein product [Thlaspi arvense]
MNIHAKPNQVTWIVRHDSSGTELLIHTYLHARIQILDLAVTSSKSKLFFNEFESSGCNSSDYFHGVVCDNKTGAVTKLQLPSGCLTGALKPNSSLFGFNHLRYLDLSFNDFTSSSLPSEFSNLNRLEVLSLSSNGFIGQVSLSFNNFSQLSYLDLSYNNLSGTLMNPNSSLFELHHLVYLDLSHNKLGSSSIPSEIGKLNRLEVLFLSFMGLKGEVPSSISNLTNLIKLDLSQNKLTGSFQLVQNLTKLSILDLSDNHFSGAIPSSLLTMPFLLHLDLGENYLTDPIKVSNSSSSTLEHLLLGDNLFEGRILEPISKLITLISLHLSYLSISYPIDIRTLSSLKSLQILNLADISVPKGSRSKKKK